MFANSVIYERNENMKKLTISVSGGKVAWQHNKRLSHSANVSPALSKYNIVIKDCDDLKTEFNDFFAPFVQAYNEKQNRKKSVKTNEHE